jgi:hypothetical protein
MEGQKSFKVVGEVRKIKQDEKTFNTCINTEKGEIWINDHKGNAVELGIKEKDWVETEYYYKENNGQRFTKSMGLKKVAPGTKKEKAAGSGPGSETSIRQTATNAAANEMAAAIAATLKSGDAKLTDIFTPTIIECLKEKTVEVAKRFEQYIKTGE